MTEPAPTSHHTKSPSIIERILDFFFKRRVIVNCERQPYLNRWYIFRSERVAIMLHKFVRSDEDRALHCHPWDFLVIPIWRGYIEHNERDRECPHCEGEGTIWLSVPEHWATCSVCKRTGRYRKPNTTRVYPLIGTRFRRAEYKLS